MNPVLLRNVFFPLYHGIKHTGVMHRIKEYQSNQWLSQAELKELQQEKLRSLLSHVAAYVPFYRERFRTAGVDKVELNDPETALRRLPLLSKHEINQNRWSLTADNKAGGRLISNSTSGSTGEALYFFTDLRSAACRRAVVIRNQEWLGVKLGDRQASLWGAAIDIDKLKNIRGRIHRWFNNYVILSSFDLSPVDLRKYVDCLNRFVPVLMTSYPGTLTELAKFKELIEKALKCPVYNRYGCREFGDVAHQCEQRQGLHINADRCLVEILDDEGRPCRPGKSGEIVVTDLDNYGMPLIRYRIGDRGRFASKTCSCGRGLPLLEEVEGRTLDLIKACNGWASGGTFWTILFKSRPGIKVFQVVQTELDGITVKYVRDPNVKEIPLDFFSENIRAKYGTAFRIIYEEVDRIEKTASGKTRIVVSYLPAGKERLT
jgi:phenylacetate-CoA ligase